MGPALRRVKDKEFGTDKPEKRVAELMQDDDVEKKAGYIRTCSMGMSRI